MRAILALLLALLTAGSPAAGVGYRLLQIDGLHMKWGAPALGSGAAVTWGLATGRASFPDAINCGELAPMAELGSAWSIPPEELDRVVAQAFGLWSAVADVRFHKAAPGAAPDILIGTQAVPRRIAFANVWWDAEVAVAGVAPLTRATVCFNPQVAWAAGRKPGALDLRYALAHEIGHALGLDHPGPTGALMGFRSQPGMRGLMPGDIAGAVALYGEP